MESERTAGKSLREPKETIATRYISRLMTLAFGQYKQSTGGFLSRPFRTAISSSSSSLNPHLLGTPKHRITRNTAENSQRTLQWAISAPRAINEVYEKILARHRGASQCEKRS